MQPRPMAETFRPVFPSLRFCIYRLCFTIATGRGGPSTRLVLVVADLFEPVDGLAVELLLDGDMAHRRGWAGAVPVLFAGREPDHVARPDVFDRPALALSPAAAG